MPSNAHYFGSWPGEPRRKIIDVTDPDTRRAFQAAMSKKAYFAEPRVCEDDSSNPKSYLLFVLSFLYDHGKIFH